MYHCNIQFKKSFLLSINLQDFNRNLNKNKSVHYHCNCELPLVLLCGISNIHILVVLILVLYYCIENSQWHNDTRNSDRSRKTGIYNVHARVPLTTSVQFFYCRA